jgi:hypothetical protein
MKRYGEVEVYIRVFLISVLEGSEWSVSSSGGFAYGKMALNTH